MLGICENYTSNQTNFNSNAINYRPTNVALEKLGSVPTEGKRVMPQNVEVYDDPMLSYLQNEVPELTELLGKKTDWLDAIYIFFELMKLSIEGKNQEQLWRSLERKLQLEQIDQVVKNLEKTAEDQFSAGIMGGLTGILSGLLPMVGYTAFGESFLGVLQSATGSFKGLPTVDAYRDLGKMMQSMSQMEQGMMDVRKTNAEADRHNSMQNGDITRSYCDDITRNRQELLEDLKSTLQAVLQFLMQNKEVVNSLYGAS